ncbi:hypothetical protein [Vibrio vulnificus]|uniref:hypothetical protein n=1 Tax=Vibrio vulnificus TaxID=672 RepID=UPI000B4C30D8|nr:hypothetical protein [Vibrio vulnificus]EGR0550899.1 hypothetical protein [Vibrio cholerae]EIZ1047444.1 hypothetical protein [Vibrio parahaemolyticus]ASC57165.1 hypothetical protein FORC37_1471 [Vibrio vulnificus]AVW98935.1 hypothetical protein BJD94_02940 [Vibrio vulnificus Env1]EHD1699174.1 hypothetical protein [Vibrio vulnificus]
MNYHIPENLPIEFLNSIGIQSIDSVLIDVVNGGEKTQCYNNVRKYLEINNGEVQFGWIFSKLGNVVLKLHAHAVVKLADGSLVCVTPPESGLSEILFAPDNSVLSLIVNDRLPTKAYALVDEKVVQEFVKLENLESKMRLDGNQLAIAYIAQEKFKLSSRLIQAVDRY